MGIIHRSCQRFGMLFYKMTCTFQVEETGRDDILVAKYMNYKLKTPQFNSQLPKCLRNLRICQETLQYNKKAKPAFLSKKKIHSADYPRLLLSSFLLFFLWQRALSYLTNVISRYYFKSRRQRQGWQGIKSQTFCKSCWSQWKGLVENQSGAGCL